MKPRVAIITNIPSHYRLSLWSVLSGDQDIDYHFIGSSCENKGIKLISSNDLQENNIRFHIVKNTYVKGICIWQSGVFDIVRENLFDHYIFNADMYCLSTWLAAKMAILQGKKVSFWGHGIYGNENWLKKKIRIIFLKIPHTLILYNNRAKRLLVNEGFNPDKIVVVYNSLQYEKQKAIYQSLKSELLISKKKELFGNNLPLLIFTGRLTKSKRLDLLIKALQICRQRGKNYNLLLLGDGPEANHLKSLAMEHLKNQVKFWGSCYDENIIGELFFIADLTVSPGNVGLTAIHSLTYGTPVITHDNFANQRPEVEIIEDGDTGSFFKRNDPYSLSLAIDKWLANHPDDSSRRDRCRQQIEKYYNPYYQKMVFSRLILDCN